MFVLSMSFEGKACRLECSALVAGQTLTLSFVIDAALGFRLELGLDAVEELIEALGRADLGASHDAGRIVVHDGSVDGGAGRGQRR